LKRENGTWAKKNKEKAELFAEHLENTFTPNTSEDVEDELDEVINEETGIIPPVSILYIFILSHIVISLSLFLLPSLCSINV
jgi:hypothetical protein